MVQKETKMDNINRIKDIIGKIETNQFVLQEQTFGNVIGLGKDLLGGVWDAASGAINKGVPYLVDKTTNHKLLVRKPFSGHYKTVVSSAAKLFNNVISNTIDSKTDVYNTLIIIDNLVEGTLTNKILDGNGKDFYVSEILEAFTFALYFTFKGQSFDKDEMWKLIKSDKAISPVLNSVISEIDQRINYNSTIGDDAQKIKEFLVNEFFESGKQVNNAMPWNNSKLDWSDDRLMGDWKVGQLKILLNDIDLTEYEEEGRVKSEFESKLESLLPCYETAKFTFVKMNNSEEINGAVKVDGRWTHILFFRNDVLTLNVYHDGTGNPPVTTTTKIECHSGDKNDGSIIDNVVGVNESFIIEQVRRGNYIFYGKVRFEFDSDSYEKMRKIYLTDSGKSTEPAPEQSQQQGSEDSTTTTTTSAPESSQSDSNKEETPASSGTPNTDKLIKLLIEKGVQEIVANNPKHRASMGSVSVGALINKVVTQEEYTKNEESMYAAKFIESIEKGYTKFNTSGKTNHEEKAKKEEKVITTTSNISNPTPLELNKIEEIGDDARAKTSNELSFDKNRIKTVRITSDEKTVVYIAKEDITDIVSDIEGQLERVFGGDWKLDSAKNKFMSSNKVFIFSKKEE